MELFAGHAVLTSAAKQAGLLNSIAVDRLRRPAARATIFQLDLCKASDLETLWTWLTSPLLCWVHLAPVCGTASRERNMQRKPSDPKPLRSLDFLHGLPHLDGIELQRVLTANSLYQTSCEIFEFCCSNGIAVTLKNPSSSYLWNTDWILRLMRRFALSVSDSQMCMLGGSRPKWTRLLSNLSVISTLDIQCDGSHQHDRRGPVSNHAFGKRLSVTPQEAKHPFKFCAALVSAVLEGLADHGLVLQQDALHQLQASGLMHNKLAQISTGSQPKAHQLPPVVRDYCRVEALQWDPLRAQPCALLSKLCSALTIDGFASCIPKGSRFLRYYSKAFAATGEDKAQALEQMRKSVMVLVFGIPWEPESFIKEAVKNGHPMNSCRKIPEELRKAVQVHLDWPAGQLRDFRIQWCRKWVARAQELQAAEEADRKSRPPHVAEATKNKNLLVTKEILEEIGYADVECLQLLSCGSTLAGEIVEVPVFARQFKPCLSTVGQLQREAAVRNQLILSMTKSSGCSRLDSVAYDETLLEVSKGWTDGPWLVEELPAGATVSRRFPIEQGDKVRTCTWWILSLPW